MNASALPGLLTPPQQLVLDLGHRAAQGRGDFLVSPSNRDAVAFIDMWPHWPAPCLVIHGPAACGKTHLCAVWREMSGAVSVLPAQIADTGAEDLAGLGAHLVFDGIDPWVSDRAAETKLFHVYNIMKEQKRTMMITMRMAPAQAPFALPDLASRLRAAPAAAIHPPDDALLAAVMVKLFADRQIQVGPDALAYILPRMERSFSAARDLVAAADRLALTEKKPVTTALLRRVLLQSQEQASL